MKWSLDKRIGLKSQLLLLLLAALAASQIISFMLFFDERRLAVRAALGQETAGRTVNTVQLLESTPPGQHADVLRSVRSPAVAFQIAAEPAVSRADDRNVAGIAAEIRAGLDNGRDRDIRSAIREASGLPMLSMHRMHDRMHGPAGDTKALALSVQLQNGGWLNVLTAFHRPPPQWAWPSVVSMALMAVAIVVIVWFSVRRIARPLEALAQAADRFGRGGTVEPVSVTGPADVRMVTEAFNIMQERLAMFVEERTQTLAALSHDLRSPLTALRLRTESLEDGEDREALVRSVVELQKMVEAALEFAKGVGANETLETTDVVALVRDVVDEFALMGKQVEISEAQPTTVELRRAAVKRALRNLIDNAIRYGRQPKVSLTSDRAHVWLVVEDEGPGIPPAELDRVLRPFERLETSRNRNTGGAGLGLAIVQSIVQAHGGVMEIQNKAGNGLRVGLGLPR